MTTSGTLTPTLRRQHGVCPTPCPPRLPAFPVAPVYSSAPTPPPFSTFVVMLGLLRRNLDLPVYKDSGSPIQCHHYQASMDPRGDHASIGKCGLGVVHRHNAIRKLFARHLLKAAGPACQQEVPFCSSSLALPIAPLTSSYNPSSFPGYFPRVRLVHTILRFAPYTSAPQCGFSLGSLLVMLDLPSLPRSGQLDGWCKTRSSNPMMRIRACMSDGTLFR